MQPLVEGSIDVATLGTNVSRACDRSLWSFLYTSLPTQHNWQ